MKLFIITGASRGLGKALAILSLNEGNIVISLSRTKSAPLPNLIQITHDLSRVKGLDTKLDRAIKQIDMKKIKQVVLVNNAAMIEPIGMVEDLTMKNMEEHLQLNLLAPMLMCSWLIKRFKKTKKFITIANISSGAAFHTIANWSMYCSTKSALKMFTDCIIKDNDNRNNFRAFSFSPGVMDTGMQATIRKKSKSKFKEVSRFKELKQKNMLLSPDKVASRLMSIIVRPEKIDQDHYDVGQFND